MGMNPSTVADLSWTRSPSIFSFSSFEYAPSGDPVPTQDLQGKWLKIGSDQTTVHLYDG